MFRAICRILFGAGARRRVIGEYEGRGPLLPSDPSRPREPIVNAPTIVLVLIAALVIVHAIRDWLPFDQNSQWLLQLAFVPARLLGSDGSFSGTFFPDYSSLLTHAFLHADWLHLMLNSAWLLAFGTFMARRCHPVGFLVLFAISSIAGALFFLVLHVGEVVWLVGASGGISGLMGAAFRVIFVANDFGGIAVLREYPNAVPRLPLRQTLAHRGTMVGVVLWLGINLILGLGLSTVLQAGDIAWEAHTGGFLFGFLAFAWFDRGPDLDELERRYASGTDI